MTRTARLSQNEVARLQADCMCAPATCRAYPNVSEASRIRLEGSARRLGIILPTAVDCSALDGPDPVEA